MAYNGIQWHTMAYNGIQWLAGKSIWFMENLSANYQAFDEGLPTFVHCQACTKCDFRASVHRRVSDWTWSPRVSDLDRFASTFVNYLMIDVPSLYAMICSVMSLIFWQSVNCYLQMKTIVKSFWPSDDSDYSLGVVWVAFHPNNDEVILLCEKEKLDSWNVKFWGKGHLEHVGNNRWMYTYLNVRIRIYIFYIHTIDDTHTYIILYHRQ